MSDLYILADDGRTPVPCDDSLAWGRWMHENRAKCSVGLDSVGAAYVSTIFFGSDMNILGALFGGAVPLLFETIGVDAGGEIVLQARCWTWAQAEKLHSDALEKLRRMVAG